MISAGTINGDIHIGLPKVEEVLRHRAGAVPPRARAFQHRDAPTPGIGGAHTTLLVGLGGVGKTQMAADFAETLWETRELDLLVWVTASSREAVVAEYAALAVVLLSDDGVDPERGARRLLDWLATAPARWLVVLDDIQVPADLAGLWPPTTTGRVIATTRRRDTALRGIERELVDVGVFTSAESDAYLRTAFQDSEHLLDSVAELAGDLEHLPLALAQASAYALDRQLSCDAYRTRFADRKRRLESLFPERSSLPDDYRATVATTWILSVELADQLAPSGLARPLLAVASLLDANGIPAEIFTSSPVLEHLSILANRTVDEGDSDDGLWCLHRLSLITVTTSSPTRTVRVHSLVQRATRDDLGPAELRSLTHVAARALHGVWPPVERDPGFAEILRVNTDALETATDGLMWDCRCRSLLFTAAISRQDSGAAVAARDLFTRLAGIACARLGEDHEDTLRARDYQARCAGEAGNIGEAVAEFEALAVDCERMLGPEHYQTLGVLNNLAYWRAHLGDIDSALRDFHHLARLQTRTLGTDHLDTLTTRSNTARWLGEGGDSAAAVSAFEALLPDQRRGLGESHILTMTSSHNLAYWHGMDGAPEKAVTGLEVVLANRSNTLGDDHPHTLSTRNNLARWRGVAGDIHRAATEFRAVLVDRSRVLGRDHPDTLATLSDCAHWWEKAGLFADAAVAYRGLLARSRQKWDLDDHSVLTLHVNIVVCLRDAGDETGTIEALEDMKAELERVYGPGHLQVTGVAAHIAELRGTAARGR